MAQENEKFVKELEELKAKCEEYLNGWKRERADFLNYKKDEMERIGNLVKYANEEIILKLLPVLDSICLAESHVPADQKDDACIAGFLQIKKQLEDFLAKEGVEIIEVLGKPFDANTMEVVEEIVRPQGSEKLEGRTLQQANEVVEEVQRGYTLHGKLVRPAKVKISK